MQNLTNLLNPISLRLASGLKSIGQTEGYGYRSAGICDSEKETKNYYFNSRNGSHFPYGNLAGALLF